MEKNKNEILKENAKPDFDIPSGPSWGMRILLVVAVLVIIGVVGGGVYLYQRSGGLVFRNTTTSLQPNSTSTKSVKETTSADINADAKSFIDQIDIAPKVTEAFAPVGASTKFAPETDTIYVAIQTTNLTEPKQIKAEWYYVEDDTFIDQALYGAEKGVNNIAFHLQQPPSGSWPEGKYEIKIYVDGELAQIAQFQVVADTSSTPKAQ
jgi:hypothetical protein